MKKRNKAVMAALLTILVIASGCGNNTNNEINNEIENEVTSENIQNTSKNIAEYTSADIYDVQPEESVKELEKDLKTVEFSGEDGFEAFLEKGGAKSDGEVISYLAGFLMTDMSDVYFDSTIFGCSTIAAQNKKGEWLFGRNFDWNSCEAMVVVSRPAVGYASISTVNMDFIRQGAGAMSMLLLSEDVTRTVALYAPLDGMNSEGLCVSVNMIEDGDTINQNTDKPDITTTTAIRLLLNKAANVEEAIKLLENYDMHASFGYMVHFAVADAKGNHVVIEYVNNEMQVTSTPIVTNFYLAEGEKNGIGSSQSHTRFSILEELLADNDTLTKEQVRDALDLVSKDNFGEFESTEWSIVFDQTNKTAEYYHREDYSTGYRFSLN